MELWELIARERIRDSLALYNWSGDAFRLSELASAFCLDGTLEIRGRDALKGRDAIIGFLGGGDASSDDESRRAARKHSPTDGHTKRVVRHNVTNIRFLEFTPEQALVACYFTVFTEIGLDHYGRYRDTFVPQGDEWLIAHRFVSTDWRSPSSTMAPPSATH
jgi:SnoaL-like domain